MFILRVAIGCILGIFLWSSAVLSQSLDDLKQEYWELQQAVNDPNLIWIPETALTKETHITRQQLEERVMTNLLSRGQYTPEKYSRVVFSAVEFSKATKLNVVNVFLPELERRINRLTSRQNNNSSSNSSSFGDLVEELASDEHLNSLSFENYIADSSGNGTAIQDSQRDSYDGNWNSASNENYSSCPKTKPDDRSSFKAYPNGQTSGGTYRRCTYFKNGYLKLEEPYVNGKLDGLQTIYRWSNEYKSSYWYQRTNYSNGKRNGLQEIYQLTKSGAVYRKSLVPYSDGIKHGDSVEWHDNGQTAHDTKFFNGKVILQYNYKKDGSFSYCTEWRVDRKPRDCKTGNVRRY